MANPTVTAEISGLQTSNNLFSSSPPGSLAVADNVVINQANVCESRRGFAAKSYKFGSTSDRAGQLHYYGTTLLVQYNSKVAYDSGSAFTDFSGTYAPINLGAPINRMQFVTAAGNCYFNAGDGLRALTASDPASISEPLQAGVPRGLYTSPTNASTNGWQTHDTAVAYRGVWGIKDANGNVKFGAPSGRSVLRNYILAPIGGCVLVANVVTVTLNANAPHYLTTGNTVTLSPGEATIAAGSYVVTVTGANTFTFPLVHANTTSTLAQEFQITRSATVREYIPADITTSHFYRLYRSDMSATSATEPSDELYQAFEVQPAAADIAAGYIDVGDITPQSFLSDPLYTNQFDGEGLQQANERPPLCRSMSLFDSRLFLGNTVQRHRFFLDMLGVGSPNGIQNNDTITFGASGYLEVYTFKTVVGGTLPVQIYASDTAALNISRTTDALIKAINANAASKFYAYSLSTDDGVPGKILLEQKLIGGSDIYLGGFYVVPSRPLSWNPWCPSSGNVPKTSFSDSNAQVHGLFYSKPGEPDSVPVLNYTTVGSQSWPILHIARIKSALIVFKQGDGIWSVTGQSPYRIEQISTANIVAPDSVKVLSDRLWALTDQGWISISESAGIAVASRPIETDILSLFGSELAAIQRYAFGIGNETDRSYTLFLPETSGSAICTEAYRQSIATQAFSRWTKSATCGVIDPNTTKLVLASGTANQILVERKDFAASDYADEDFAVTISSSTGKAVTLVSATGVTAGDALTQGTITSLVVSVSGNVLTMLTTESWTAAAGTVYPGISCDVKFNPVTGGDPALSKHSRQITWLFKDSQFYSADAEFSSDQSAGTSTIAMLGTGFGYQAWGSGGWGSPQIKLKRIHPLPEAKRICNQLTVGFSIRQALSKWKLQGFVLSMDGISEQNSR